MSEQRLTPLFGANVDPATRDPQEPFRRAKVADEYGLDLITVQDHAYNSQFLETWTLLATLAQATKRVHFGPNVLTTPLRLPAMMAKMAATLDVLSGGRVELGLGAGAFAEGIQAFGGVSGTAGERYQAFKEYIEIVKGLWTSTGHPFSYSGKVYQVHEAQFGPAPAHPIRVWTGSQSPRSLRLTGQIADGLMVSTTYVSLEQLLEFNRLIDEGAAATGRPTTAIRRCYNLMGVLDLGPSNVRLRPHPGLLSGPVEAWVTQILRFYHDYRQDTFIFWPVAGDELAQIEVFAREVVPAVRKELGNS
jgi:alkanesulfonate monooxygenase SsuD/methylene tetrahydromethanopterin reductase-like flavin-dependent oxidoreductase (luciferase family)